MKASQLLEMAAEQAACAKDEYCAKLRDPRAWGRARDRGPVERSQ